MQCLCRRGGSVHREVSVTVLERVGLVGAATLSLVALCLLVWLEVEGYPDARAEPYRAKQPAREAAVQTECARMQQACDMN